jgi:hypothetical protein
MPKYCTECGAELSPKAMYCPACEARVWDVEPLREWDNYRGLFFPQWAGGYKAVLRCPRCHNILRRGARVGPPLAICSNCGTQLHTNLEQWGEIPENRKIEIRIAEALFPSSIPYPFLFARLWFFYALCFVCAASTIFQPNALQNLDLIVPMCLTVLAIPVVFVAIQHARLQRMIRESEEYAQSGKIPIW